MSASARGSSRPNASTVAASTSSVAPPLPRSSHSRRRVVMHVDMDCFYAQVDRERYPHWRGEPIAVVQNGTLVVTSNYRVRERGLPKMGSPDLMKAACELTQRHVKFSGSNMVRYRAASKAWYTIFQSFPRIVVMKKSIDESYLDLTEEAAYRIREGAERRAVRQSEAERKRLADIAAARFAAATKAWQAEDQQMLTRGISPVDLESTGSLRAAQYFSKSTDPITELRRQRAATGSAPDETKMTAAIQKGLLELQTNPKHLKIQGLSEEEIEAHCNRVHPIDHCRADKRHPPCMLVPLSDHVDPESQLPGVDTAPWRQHFVGYVFLDGTDTKVKSPSPASSSHHAAAASSSSSHNTASDSALEDDPDDIAPCSSFAHEDPLDPSHDHLLAVGSQIAYDIRSTLFMQLGFTTSGSVAPNCMLAKVASSLNKPNQQSVVRASIAPKFLRDIKLEAISGFGPKACEEVAEHNLVTVGDVQRMPLQTLMKSFSEKFSAYLLDISQAIDDTPVLVHVAPKSIGQSKRQRTNTHEERISLLQWLCEKLQERIIEDEKEFHRRPTILTFSWITADVWTNISRRCALPPYKEHRTDGLPVHAEMFDACVKMCKMHLEPTVKLRCLAIGVSQFVPLQQGKGIAGYFGSAASSSSSSSDVVLLPDTFSSSTSAASSSTPFSAKPAKPSQPKLAAFLSSTASSASSPLPSTALESSTSASSSAALSDMPDLEAPSVTSSITEEGALREKYVQQLAAANESIEDGVMMTDVAHQKDDIDEDDIEEMFGGSGSQRRNENGHQAASSSSLASSSSTVSTPSQMICPTCSHLLPASSFTEHMDWHFATSFQSEIRKQDRIEREKEQQNHQSTSSSASNPTATAKRKKGAIDSSSSLDRFMKPSSTPSQPAAPSQVAQRTPQKSRPVGVKRTSAASSSSPAATTPTLNNFFKAKQ